MYAPLGLDAQLAAVAARLAARRDALLQRWHQAARDDRQLTTADSLSRAQFFDHIPTILQGLYEALTSGRSAAVSTAAEKAEAGATHGKHRWQQGYSLIEVMREWSHLQIALIDEMRHIGEELPGLDVRVINTAYRAIATICLEGMSESALQFEQMQRAEAAGQVSDLSRTLDAARAVEKRQAEILRGAAHDLRGNLGIVSTATAALTLDTLPKERRAELFGMAQRAITAHTRLLSDLMDLARLQAGYEQPRIERCNVSQALRELCQLTEPVAHERGLYLRCDGPDELTVDADITKTGRILQNLLLNALHYTEQGGVWVRWSEGGQSNPKHWRLTVEDSGPGIQQASAGPLAGAIEEATQIANSIGDGADSSDVPSADRRRPPLPPRHGEGIGLSIVKRLAELLDATLEMESRVGSGTTFTVAFPRQYSRSD